jgi:hypothetical protein
MGETERGTQGRWEAWLFLGLALLSVVPFWSATYLPTTDGPCHLYNAWILHQHGDPEAFPQIARHYEIDWRPIPNWLSHGFLALVMAVLPPLAAEKLLASAYVVTFLGGLWMLVGAVRPGSRWPAFLGFPFLYNFLFQFGFYNFSFSLGLFFFVLAIWWRHRDSPTLALAVKLNLLLLLGWFAHILTVVFSLFSIGVLWLATLRRESWKRQLLHIPILLPQLLLPLWFVRAEGGETSASQMATADLLRYFARLGPLVTFSPWQAVAASLLVMLVLALAGVTLLKERREGGSEAGGPRGWGWQREHAFALVALLFVALLVYAPDGMSGGSMLKPRLALYPFLMLIPWFTRTLPAWGRKGLIALLSVAAVANVALQVERYRALSPEIASYLRPLERVKPGARILPLTFERQGSAGLIGIFNHAIGYAALDKGLIEWDNYEAASTLFPVRFREGLHRPAIYSIEADPANFPLASYVDAVDYVYTWGLPAGAPVAASLATYYRLVESEGPGLLFRRRRNVRAPNAPEPPHPVLSYERRSDRRE